MPGDVLIGLAQFAGQTVAGAAITGVWEAVRGRFARLLGRGDARKTQVADHPERNPCVGRPGVGPPRCLAPPGRARMAGRGGAMFDRERLVTGGGT